MDNFLVRKNKVLFLLSENLAQQEIALGLALDFMNDFGDENQKIEATQICTQYRKLLKNDAADISSIATNKENLIFLLEKIKEKKLQIPDKQLLVKVSNIKKSFNKSNFTLQDLSLSFLQGEITGIVGANANGKSTLVKIIVGELLQDAGTIQFPKWQGEKTRFSWQKMKQNIAYLPQELVPWSGGLRENLSFEATLHGVFGNKNDIAVDFIIERLNLNEYVNSSWDELSGGYKLRYALAKALVWSPELLILDEPLANLDINAQLVVLSDLKALSKSLKNPVGVILTSQHIHEVELVADQIIVLDKGVLKYVGTPHSFENEQQENIFEFHTSLTINELKDKLKVIFIENIQPKGAYFIAYAPKKISSEQFLSYAAANGIRLHYFRDITHSVKQLFL